MNEGLSEASSHQLVCIDFEICKRGGKYVQHFENRNVLEVNIQFSHTCALVCTHHVGHVCDV